MPKFIFECPECGGGMEADTSWIGAPVQCPHCLKSVTIKLKKASKVNKKQSCLGCLICILVFILFWAWIGGAFDNTVEKTNKEKNIQQKEKDKTSSSTQTSPEKTPEKKREQQSSKTKKQGKDAKRKKTLPDKHEAWVKVQYIVESQLKNPDSAKFGYGWRNVEIAEESGIYIFRSYVDATNSFGGKVRTYFFCKLRWTQYEKWELLKLTFSEHPF